MLAYSLHNGGNCSQRLRMRAHQCTGQTRPYQPASPCAQSTQAQAFCWAPTGRCVHEPLGKPGFGHCLTRTGGYRSQCMLSNPTTVQKCPVLRMGR